MVPSAGFRLTAALLSKLAALSIIGWKWNVTSWNASHITSGLSGAQLVGCTEQNCGTLVANLFILYSLVCRFSEKLNSLWGTAYLAQFLTASILICFIGLTAVTVSTDGSTANWPLVLL
jgi:hypothetical protein